MRIRRSEASAVCSGCEVGPRHTVAPSPTSMRIGPTRCCGGQGRCEMQPTVDRATVPMTWSANPDAAGCDDVVINATEDDGG